MMKANYIYIFIVSMALCYLSIDIFMINTGDFDRAILPFMNGINQFNTSDKLLFQMFPHFKGISSYEYKSSFSYILYAYASFISIFTHTFDLRIWSALCKVLFVFILYVFYTRVSQARGIIATIIFPAIAAILFTPSIISQFSSFYQDQAVITLLPLSLLFALKADKSKKAYVVVVISACVIATAKSQFFYYPLLLSAAFLAFRGIKSIKFHAPLAAGAGLGLVCVLLSPSATVNNNYHSLYFGSLLYNKINNIQYPEWVKGDCVGIDAWGNAFDMERGAKATNIGTKCLFASDGKGIKESLLILVKHPASLIKLPFDDAIKTQLTENYFHVYKVIKLIKGKSQLLDNIEDAKEKVLKASRFSICVLIMIASLVMYKKELSMITFVISAFSISQFYISFIGEGYRDLNKHLFAMNYSCDLLIFVIAAIAAGVLIKRFSR